MSKVLSAMRKNAKTIFISVVILAFVVVFAILNTESALDICKLFGISTIFTAGSILVAAVLSIPSIIYRAINLKKGPVKLSGGVRFLVVVLFLVFIIAPGFILDMIPSIGERSFIIRLPQAFVEDQYAMTFDIASIIFFGVVLMFAGNLMILSWENRDSIGSKICKILTGFLFATLLHWVLVWMDYVSTMLSLNYFTTVGIASIIGMYIGYGVYGKVQDKKDRKLRAKGL